MDDALAFGLCVDRRGGVFHVAAARGDGLGRDSGAFGRQESAFSGLEYVPDAYDYVVLHDGVSTERILVYVVLLMSGIQMVVLGVFGEYLARAYIESKHRPLYIVRRSYQIPSR